VTAQQCGASCYTERTLPVNRDELARYVIDHKRENFSLDEPADELVSHLQLLRHAPDVEEPRLAVQRADRHAPIGGTAGDQAPGWGETSRSLASRSPAC
jgi:hypothetical protein